MTDKETIDKLQQLGWKMYYAMQDLTTDTRPIKEAMKAWWNYINHELNSEKRPLIQIPFGAKDSELIEETITIPDGYYAVIEGNKVLIKNKCKALNGINNMIRDLDQASKAYRDYREQGGIKDPIMLDEIEEAYYAGMEQGLKEEPVKNCEICPESSACALGDRNTCVLEEPVSDDLEEELESFFYPRVPWGDLSNTEQEDIKEWSLKIARHFANFGKEQAKIEIQAQSMALAHGCHRLQAQKGE